MSDAPNIQILLARRPKGTPSESDFAVREAPIPEITEGAFLIRNEFLSMDAGFRQWMNEGSGDNYLAAMPLDHPVMSITVGHVVESRHAEFPVGTCVMGRNRWETYSLSNASDYVTMLEPSAGVPLHYYVGVLGPTGLTAYFGMLDIGQPEAGETVVISAAAGAVGSVAGQIAKMKGCKTIGITSSTEKGEVLIRRMGYDAALNYNAEELLAEQLGKVCPDGIDIYFDNVGGATLDTMLAHMKENARIVLCGAVGQYNLSGQTPGIHNMWEAVTKRATLKGFMFSDHVDRYPAALAELQGWLQSGDVKSFHHVTEGIINTPAAFCGMFRGENIGKAVVRV